MLQGEGASRFARCRASPFRCRAYYRGLHNSNRVPLKGSFQGYYKGTIRFNIGALTIRMGFWGPFYYHYNEEPPKIILVNI